MYRIKAKKGFWAVFLFSMFFSSLTNAQQIIVGKYKQTSSSAGDCANCEITISREVPHIIKISANNGWIGYAYYIEQDAKYYGAFQWKSGLGYGYPNVLFIINLTYGGGTLVMNADSDPLSFTATFRRI